MRNTSILNFDRLIAHKKFYEPGLHMPWHTDKHSRISITIDGSWEEKTDFETVSANSPSVVIKPKEAWHETTFGKKGCTIISVQFADETIFPGSFRGWDCIVHPGLALSAVKLWASLKKVKSEKEFTVIFDKFLTTIHSLKERKKPNRLLLQAQQLLTTTGENKKTIQAISDEVHLHRVYLSRAFKKDHGCPPSVYARQLRLLKAIGYLSVPGVSLAGAAYDAEYADQSHMSRAIKNEFGCTPAQLKKYFN
jgi:AraC-like DNA-binding protein